MASVTFRACSYRCHSCSSHPLPALFSSKTSASWVLTVSSAPDSEQAITFGSFSLLGSHLRPRLLLTYWLVGAAARELASRFSPFLFLWSLSHSEVSGWGAGMGLPIGWFLFQLWGCPPYAVAVAGIRCRVLQARPFFGTVTLFLFKTFLFPS